MENKLPKAQGYDNISTEREIYSCHLHEKKSKGLK